MLKLINKKENRGEKSMIDKICKFLTDKMRKEMPDIDDEKAEVLNYGLQNLIGEVPKAFILIGLSWVLGILPLTLAALVFMIPYRVASGGFHLKTHLGCIITTNLFYNGTAYLSKYLVFTPEIKYTLIALVWIFGMIMIKLYAPADTENVPILRKKERRQKQIASYIILTIGLIIAIWIPFPIISNIIIVGYFVQTCTITRVAYRLTKNKYGYEVYESTSV